jgi:hypothetical protein
MRQQPTVLQKRMADRAARLRALVPQNAHPALSRAVQVTFACVESAANIVPLLQTGYFRYLDRNEREAKSGKRKESIATYSVLLATAGYKQLTESLSHLAGERDTEALKVLGTKSLGLVLGVFARLSGVQYVKEAAEIVVTLKEVVATGHAAKHRRQQARAASELMRWLDAVALVAMAWQCEAQRYLYGTIGKAQESTAALVRRVERRIMKASRNWH